MKKSKGRSRKRATDLHEQSFTRNEAKTYLGRLIEKVAKGETVYILKGQQRFILQEVAPIDPIPLRPPGYFANRDSKKEIQQENRLAKASTVRAPADLE